MAALVFVICVYHQASANTDDAGDDIQARFQRVITLRADGEYDRAVEQLRIILRETTASNDVLRNAYHHLVQTYVEKGDTESARSTAREALNRFPDLSTDTRSFPAAINVIYDGLRAELFGSLVVKTEPSACDVIVDTVFVGVSPLHAELLPTGDHELIMRKIGYVEKRIQFRISPGRQATIEATLDVSEPFGVRGRYSVGFDIGPNHVWLSEDSDIMSPGDAAIRLSAGVFARIGVLPLVYFQPGLRFVRLGSSHIAQDYLSAPLLLTVFPVKSIGLYFSAGPELSFLLNSKYLDVPVFTVERTREERLTDLDITSAVRDFNLCLVTGIGYEFRIARLTTFINLQFSLGVVNNLKIDELGWETRESKISSGLIF